ncbi:MAG TPA: enoyl-CoA hydratase [Steroidobacteraceae bacterium]|nr:enoyl-CoA hydratase [Steroidobacteraceae bacterium]
MSIAYQMDQGVASITFDRAAKKNAITGEMYLQFVGHLRQASADSGVRAVLVSGSGGTFTAGNDLKDFSNPKFAQIDSPVLSFMQGLAAFEKPVIAAVQGLAVGIGVTMLLHCDLVYLADDATLSMPFTSLGLVPEFASTYLLPLIAGRVRASEKLLLGKPFPAHEAVVMGLANAVLPAGDVVAHATKVARAFAALPPGAVRDTKKLLREAQAAAVKDAIFREASHFGPRLAGDEAREAIAAIIEKRPPDFSKFS